MRPRLRSPTLSGPDGYASCAGSGRGSRRGSRELVETGEIAELEELEREVQPELVGLGRLPRDRREAGGARDRADARCADGGGAARGGAAGRLAEVPGIGPQKEAKLLAALDRADDPRPPRGMLIRRARDCSRRSRRRSAASRPVTPGGVKDSSERFAVVVPADDPAPVLQAFEDAAGDRLGARPFRAPRVRRDRRGRPGRARGRGARTVRHRARPRNRLAGIRRRARAAAGRARRGGRLPRARRSPSARSSSARRRSAASRRRWSSSPTSAATSTATRRGRTAARPSRRWRSPRSSAATSTWRSATTRRPSRVVQGLNAGDLRRQAIEIAAANEALAPFRVLRGTECDILPDGQLDLSPSILRELDWVQASVHGGQRLPKRKQTERVRAGAAQRLRLVPLAPERPVHQPPRRERARHRPADRGRARGGRRARGERAARPARPQGRVRRARRSRRA